MVAADGDCLRRTDAEPEVVVVAPVVFESVVDVVVVVHTR